MKCHYCRGTGFHHLRATDSGRLAGSLCVMCNGSGELKEKIQLAPYWRDNDRRKD